MPWSKKDYPRSWRNFPEKRLEKTIEIGNALLDEGYPDERAIPIATKTAKDWYEKKMTDSND